MKDSWKKINSLDFMYSTNLSKNKYAIDDIVGYINSNEFKIILNNIWEDTSKKISELKFWLSNKRAISFFSKYLFYITDFNFPIYDSLVIKSSKTIFNGKITQNNFYSELYSLKSKYWVTFEELDWFLWLFWKINKWSYTTFLSKIEFIKFEKTLNEKNQNLDIKKFDEILNILLDLKTCN